MSVRSPFAAAAGAVALLAAAAPAHADAWRWHPDDGHGRHWRNPPPSVRPWAYVAPPPVYFGRAPRFHAPPGVYFSFGAR